jgi:hypothetical protein
MNVIGNKKHNKFSRKWINKIGVFKIPSGGYIVRIPQENKPPTTIAKRETRKEARELFKKLTQKTN